MKFDSLLFAVGEGDGMKTFKVCIENLAFICLVVRSLIQHSGKKATSQSPPLDVLLILNSSSYFQV